MPSAKQLNPIDVHVGGRVRLQRMILRISQEKLGDSLGITFQQIQKYEKGTNRISASRLEHISRVLAVPVSYFFEGAPGAPAEQPEAGAIAESTHSVVDFLSSDEGLQLNRAFVRIEQSKIRRKIVDLVRALGEERGAAL